MKNAIILLLLTFSYLLHSQQFILTPEGLRDSENKDNAYVILHVDNKTSNQLYTGSMNYIKRKFPDLNDLSLISIDNQYIKIQVKKESVFNYKTFAGIRGKCDANYSLELEFKEGKVKCQVSVMEMLSEIDDWFVTIQAKGGIEHSYPIYNKKGVLIREETKLEIEQYFKEQISDLYSYLKEEDTDDDW